MGRLEIRVQLHNERVKHSPCSCRREEAAILVSSICKLGVSSAYAACCVLCRSTCSLGAPTEVVLT
jgi:hypothetical protein